MSKFKVSFKREIEGKKKTQSVLFSGANYGDVETQFYNYCEENEIAITIEDYKIVPSNITDIIVHDEGVGVYWLITCIEEDLDSKATKRYVLIEAQNDIEARKEIEEIVEVKSTVLTNFIDVI